MCFILTGTPLDSVRVPEAVPSLCKEFVKNASMFFKSLPFDSPYEYSVVLLINFFSGSVSITT
jgi:hypothetical protein